jgi:hypothetical protein
MITYRVPEGGWFCGLAGRFPQDMAYSYIVLPEWKECVTHTETDSEYRQRAWKDWNGRYNL